MNYRRALKVSTLSQVVLFGLSLLSVVVVSRLLTPAEIGVFSVSVSLLSFAHVFREFGVGQYLVQAPSVGRREFRAAFSVGLACSWVMAALVALLAYPLSRLYEHEGVFQVLLLASLNFVAMPFGTPSLSMLRRELQFTRIAWLNIVGAVVQALVTILAAFLDQSYLSMAWGTLAMQLSKILLLQLWRPGEVWLLPTTQGLREVLRFGGMATGATTAGAIGQAAPDLVLGKTLGFADVAYLSRGMSLISMLIEKIHELVRNVFFPMFAGQLRDGGKAPELYLAVVSNLVVVTAPLLLLLAIVADPLIPWMFGDQWKPSVSIAVVICLSHVLGAPIALYGPALTAVGAIAELARIELMNMLAKVLLLSSSLWFGLDIVVYFIAAGILFEIALAYRGLQRVIGLKFVQLIKVVTPCYAVAGVTAVAAWIAQFACRSLSIGQAPRFVELLIICGAAAVGWLVAVFAFRHPFRHEAARLVG